MPSASGEPPSEGLARAFDDVLARWDDEKAHDTFFALVTATRGFPEAARLYRAVKEGGGERAALAEKKLTQVAFLAMATLDEGHTEARKGLPTWAKWTIVVAVAAFMIWFSRRALP